MSAFFDIGAALDEHLNTMAGVPSVSWPNVEFTPVKGTIYLRPTVVMGTVERSSNGAAGHDLYSGYYQVDVLAPVGEGKKEGMEMADTVADQFKYGTELTYNGRTIRLTNITYLTPTYGENWVQIIVQIDFYSLTNERL
jgi:hypothetical protein